MVDVVIIGCGPAGISAGTVLQRKGYKTCIIDTQVFPREKLCAGVLTVKSIKLLQYIYKDLNFEILNMKHIHKITLSYNHKTIGEYTVNNAYSVINRTEFDNALLQYYKNIGGLALEGQQNYTIFYDRNVIKLSDGKEIQYRFLIGADGINSKVRSYVTQTWKASVLCFEEFIPNASNEDTIEINFGGLLVGYSWRIPGKDRIGVGLGEFYIRGMRRKPDKYRRIDHLEKGSSLVTYINRIGRIHRKMKEQNIYNKILYVPVLQLMSLRHMRKNPQFVQKVLDNAISTYRTGYTKEILQNM